ncbi:MAG TPA: wax ester/triacylglycerol synthase family O-acyltransferase [Solirubrobacteraceae bacterium]|jgi:WS/DGAT/MGAT family acyltransferase|nr:wax ester/triacylglycerol synthase family O-acyltransferase [Solirubrobacteraceae bacterium]
MRQLTGLDAQFLALESPRQAGHVGALAVLDPSTRPDGRLELEDIQTMIAERLPLLPPFRWRLKQVPFGLDYPYWIDDPDFDLEYHVRELAIPPPPTDEKVAEQVARIFARPLDRARPLWELYLIYGLADGNVGLLTKIHHSAVDGMSGAEILGVLLDLSPEGRDPPPESNGAGDPEPGTLEMLARALIGAPRYVERVIRATPSTLPNLEDTPILGDIPGAHTLGRVSARFARALRGRPSRMLERTNLTPPSTSFNGRVSAHRRFAFGRLPLDQVKAVKNHYGCTVNDVVVAICAGAVRRWLIEHDELPDTPLIAQVPVSVRTEEQRGTYGNRIGMMSPPVFTNVADPVERLQQTHEALRAAKERHKALPAQLLQDATQFIPPAVFARASQVSFSLAAARRPLWNLVISNVPGPQFPLYCAGAVMVAHYPVSVITDGMGLNITVMSYMGSLDVGIVADREQMRDVWKLIGWLRESLDELLAEP